MFRKHETAIALEAGLLAVLVHVLLVGALLVSLNWKAANTVISVSDVELWVDLPSKSTSLPKPIVPKPEPKPEPPKPEVEEPKPEPEPEPPKPEPKPEPEEPKVDIELENKKKAEEEKRKLEEEKKKIAKKKKLAEKKKKEKERREQLKKIQAAAFDDEVEDENEKALKELQQKNLDELGNENVKRSSGARNSIVNKYVAKIQAKIRGNVNNSLCSDGNPELQFKLNLLPTGDFGSRPKLTKSSGDVACDDAVERAIIASEPLPLPSEPDALAAFRNLNLKFRPNGH